MRALEQSLWPCADADRAVRCLAREAGLDFSGSVHPSSPPSGSGRPDETRALAIGLRLRRVEVEYTNLDVLLKAGGPAILLCGDLDRPALLALVCRRRGKLVMLGPDGVRRRVKIEEVCGQLTRGVEAATVGAVDDLVDRAGIATGRRRKARAQLLAQRIAGQCYADCWIVEEECDHSVSRRVRREGLPAQFLRLLVAHAGQFAIWIAAWWTLGQAILADSLSRGWLLAWTLLLMASIPARLLSSWYQGMLTIGLGRISKSLLLRGVLRADLDETRRQGIGQSMARVVEAEAVETLSVSGGLISALAAIELTIAGFLLPRAAGGWPHAALLLGWVVLIAAHTALQYRRQATWTDDRLRMSEDLLEQMVGHRTRAAQERETELHRKEESMLARYLRNFEGLDRMRWISRTLAPEGWLVASLLLLAPGFLSGASSPASMAAGIGVTLLAMGAIQQFTAGQNHLIAAATAWRKARSLFRAAATADDAVGHPAESARPPARGKMELSASELVFGHDSAGRPVLDRCEIVVRSGDRIVLEGASGSGKSTLASLVVGLREPQSGRIAIDGLDRETMGAKAWSDRIVTVPQFHENHLFSATLAFNLLMGRNWPPTQAQLDEADALCRELGLGDLLDRMPSGLFQLVGETGWHLSHGERSRVFIARALLQKAPIVVLDESFAALDPHNLKLALDCADRHADSLLVIAHP